MKNSILFLLLLTTFVGKGQVIDSVASKTISSNSLDKINRSTLKLNDKITKSTLKVLKRFRRQENILRNKLALKDSNAAKQLSGGEDKIKTFTSKIKNTSELQVLREYIPQFDSLKTGLKFLAATTSKISNVSKPWLENLQSANGNLANLETKIQFTNEIKKYIKERRQQLKEQLERFGLGKELKKINKRVYYYQQQLDEYKATLKDPEKVQKRAIAELRKVPLFKNFMQKNSQLAQLFGAIQTNTTSHDLPGLQTRSSISTQLQQHFSGTAVGSTSTQYIQQSVQAAKNELNKLKNKANGLGIGNTSNTELPDFKPNTQKTKAFLKRFEFGTNIQSQKLNRFIPVTSDIALTMGYKLNDKSVVGIGMAYKLGLGNGLQHIKLSHEGIGLRSFIDYKLIKGFWISGGYEQNYQYSFTTIEVLKQFNAWQTSGLIGLTKKYKIGKKSNNFQLLWDFLSYKQLPRRQSLLFRVGIGL